MQFAPKEIKIKLVWRRTINCKQMWINCVRKDPCLAQSVSIWWKEKHGHSHMIPAHCLLQVQPPPASIIITPALLVPLLHQLMNFLLEYVTSSVVDQIKYFLSRRQFPPEIPQRMMVRFSFHWPMENMAGKRHMERQRYGTYLFSFLKTRGMDRMQPLRFFTQNVLVWSDHWKTCDLCQFLCLVFACTSLNFFLLCILLLIFFFFCNPNCHLNFFQNEKSTTGSALRRHFSLFYQIEQVWAVF